MAYAPVGRQNQGMREMTPTPLPPLHRLSEQQVRGAACVHCGVILGPTAVDLGERKASWGSEHVAWYPRACRLPHP